MLLDEIKRTGLVTGKLDEAQQAAIFEKHLEALGFMYFERAKDRLMGLQRWAEGRVTREKTQEEDRGTGF